MDLPKRSDGQLPLNYRLCTEGKQRFYVSAIFGSSHLEFVEARFKSYSLIFKRESAEEWRAVLEKWTTDFMLILDPLEGEILD